MTSSVIGHVRERMTVRDKVGRTRYVAFRVSPPRSRSALAGTLPPYAKLTRFDGEHGILRTTHRDLPALRLWLVGKLEGLATSGTMRKAAEALPASAPARTREPRPRS